MARVTYKGLSEALAHRPRFDLPKRIFIRDQPTEVPFELALMYEEMGGDFEVTYTFAERIMRPFKK